jgi:type II secretory pathway predicted ATPase ExeA
MFLEFFGLREQPFGMTPDPAYLYASKTHSEAIASLSNGIAENRGFFALIAEPGMGKTTLLYHLLEKLRDTSRTVLVFQTQCNSRELIEYILQELGVDVRGMSFVAMHGQLNEILFEELLAGKRFVLVVDEAQNLDESVLETVRMLSNFETHNAKLLQIILAGQPRLGAKLAQPELSQLRQRISVIGRLQPFNTEETGRYIEHRLQVAGHSGEPIFEPSSVGLIARMTGGIPRNINNVCYNSLFLAYTRAQKTVSPETVEEVLARLELEPPVSVPIAFPEAETAPVVAAPALSDTESVPVAATETASETESVPVSATGAIPVPEAAPVAVAAAAAAASAAAPSVGAATLPAPEATAPVEIPPAEMAALPSESTEPAAAPILSEPGTSALLTYGASKKIGMPGWPVKSALLAIVLLSGTLLVTFLGRTLAKRAPAPSTADRASEIQGAQAPANPSGGTPANYAADPQDTESGQVITVVAGPQQSLKDLTLRYVGHFDDDLSKKIASLNPDLKDPDHLEPGELIRIPLPPGAMKKVNDTAEAAAPSKPEPSGNLFSKFTAMLRGRR